MIPEYSPITQALLGTLLTWGLTLAGASMALFLQVLTNHSSVFNQSQSCIPRAIRGRCWTLVSGLQLESCWPLPTGHCWSLLLRWLQVSYKFEIDQSKLIILTNHNKD